MKPNVTIYHLIEGAKKARGLTVIIDVFRAFSMECYLYKKGVARIRPIGSIEDAFAMRQVFPDCVLIGERKGKKCEGFDFGNSPSSITEEDVAGKTVIHTTSSGTQGIVNAVHADEILTGSLVNAAAIADYIRKAEPLEVSLVCMGKSGITPTQEDELCAEYIKSLIEDEPLPDIDARIAGLRYHGGEHFFDPDNQSVYPEPDFWLCCKRDVFPFVLRVERDEYGYITKKIADL